MTAVRGYLQSHGFIEGLAVGLCAGLAFWLFRDINRIGFENWFRGPPYPVLVIAPLIISCAAIGTLYAPFDELESSFTQRQWLYRSILMGLLLTVATSGIFFALREHPNDMGMAIRNLAAMTGTAALFSLVIGARLAWMPTSIIYVAMYTSSATATVGQPGFPEIVWQWPFATARDLTALLIAISLATGILIVCYRGPREQPSI